MPLSNLPQLAAVCDAQWMAWASVCGFGPDVAAWQTACLALAGHSRHATELSIPEQRRRWVAVALALVGWRAAKTPNAIECIEDARTVGLWRFAPLQDVADTPSAPVSATAAFGLADVIHTSCVEPANAGGDGMEVDETADGPALTPVTDRMPINPFLEHRDWSPWLEIVEGGAPYLPVDACACSPLSSCTFQR